MNDDGYLDLVFGNSHDIISDVPATLATVFSGKRIQTKELAVTGCIQAELSDLNHDGFLDIVFCPGGTGLQYPRQMLTIIWGGVDGWPAHRSNGLLPVNKVRKIALADMNQDGWDDIVTLNSEAWIPGQPVGPYCPDLLGERTRFQSKPVSGPGHPKRCTYGFRRFRFRRL